MIGFVRSGIGLGSTGTYLGPCFTGVCLALEFVMMGLGPGFTYVGLDPEPSGVN